MLVFQQLEAKPKASTFFAECVDVVHESAEMGMDDVNMADIASLMGMMGGGEMEGAGGQGCGAM